MTHDQECTLDPTLCSMCTLQAEARADEREQAAARILDYRRRLLKLIRAFMDENENFPCIGCLADGILEFSKRRVHDEELTVDAIHALHKEIVARMQEQV